MFTYPSVWPLPYGLILRDDYSPSFNYSIDRSQTQCWQIKFKEWDQVNFHAMHNGWVGHQAWTLRAWLSIDPGGSNILPSNYGPLRNVHLTYFGNSWNFHVLGFNGCLLPADVDFWVYPDKVYYFNIQNTSNEKDGYYLRLSYEKNGSTFIT
jgi:hypothetical protein